MDGPRQADCTPDRKPSDSSCNAGVWQSDQADYGSALIAPGFVDLDALGDLDTTILGFDNQPAWRKGRVWPRSYVERGSYEMYSPEDAERQGRS